MKIIRLGAIALTAIAATPALAQSQDRDAHFDGPYIQAFGGYSVQSNDGDDTLVFDTDQDGVYDNDVLTTAPANAFSPGFCGGAANGATVGAGCRGDKDGAEYGARIGFDKRMGNMVIGGLIEGAKSNAKDRTAGFSTTPASYTVQRELDYSIAARARAGFTPGGGALFYATGGVAYAKIDHDFDTTNTANSFDVMRNKKGVWGWQAGGGAEVMITQNVSLGLEYLYNRFKDDKSYVLVGPGTAPATNPFLLDSGATRLRASDKNFDYHSLRAVIGFSF
ncbi:MAG: porin family protein [Sphingobacteriales bacterium]|nr:MAG: porin family protein [Sphingobacteriales bacterium]